MQQGRPPSAPTQRANSAHSSNNNNNQHQNMNNNTGYYTNPSSNAGGSSNRATPIGSANPANRITSPGNNNNNNQKQQSGHADIYSMVSVGRGTVGSTPIVPSSVGKNNNNNNQPLLQRAASATSPSPLPRLSNNNNNNNNNNVSPSPIYDVSRNDIQQHDVSGWKEPSKKLMIPGALPRHAHLGKVMQRNNSRQNDQLSPEKQEQLEKEMLYGGKEYTGGMFSMIPPLRPGSTTSNYNNNNNQNQNQAKNNQQQQQYAAAASTPQPQGSRPNSAHQHIMRFRPNSAQQQQQQNNNNNNRRSSTSVYDDNNNLYGTEGNEQEQLAQEIHRQQQLERQARKVGRSTSPSDNHQQQRSNTATPVNNNNNQQQRPASSGFGGRTSASTNGADPQDSVQRVMTSVARANDEQFEHSATWQRNRPKVAPSDAKPISVLQCLDDVASLYSDTARVYTPVKFVRMQLLAQQPGERFNPYDLRVVHPRSDGVEIPLEDYYIVSASGVVRVTQTGASSGDVISLSEFVREASVFRMLTKIPFFRRYLILKAFQQWHKNIRLKVYLETRRRTAESFFLAQSVFAKPLCFFREQAALLASQQLVQMPDNREGVTRERFAQMTSERTHKVAELFRVTLDDAETRLKNVCDEVVQRADIPDLTSPEALHQYINSLEEEEMRAAGNARRVSTKAISMVAARQNELRRMSQLKAAMHDLQQLPRFIRLVDAIAAQSLFTSALRSTLFLYHELHRRDDDRCLFFLTATTFECPEGIAFSPSRDLILSMLQDITTEMINVVTNAARLCTLKTFRDFFATLPRHVNMGTALQHDARVRSTIGAMRDSICDDFNEAREVTRPYAKNRRWYEFVVHQWPNVVQEWQLRSENEQNQKDLLKSLDPSLAVRPLQAIDFGTLFNQIEEATSNLKEMHPVRRGSLIVTSVGILDTLLNGLKGIQAEVKTRLVSLAALRLERLQQAYNARIKAVAHEKTTNVPLAKFAAFAQTVDNVSAEAGRLDDVATQIEEIMECAVMNGCDCGKESTKRELVLGGSMAAMGGAQQQSLRERYDQALTVAREFRNNSIKEMNRKLDAEIEAERENIFNTISSVDAEVLHAYRPATETQEAVDHLEVIRQNIDSSDAKFKTYISWQKIFGVATADLGLLDSLKTAYKVKNELWSTIVKWNDLRQEIYLTPVVEVDMNNYIKQVDELYTLTYAKLHNRNKNEASEKLLESLREEKMMIPTLSQLGNKHLNVEHWSRILASQQRVYDPSLTLDTLKQLRMFEPQFREIIAEQSAIASGEHQLMDTVEQVRQRWGELTFAVKKHRDQKDTFILDDVADVIQTLEEDTLTIQSCLMSRFVTAIRDRVEAWERKLVYLGQVIEEWIQVQSAWMYLEAIFASDDITKQLPEESVMFRNVDSNFRALLQRTAAVKTCITVVAEGDVLEMLKHSRETLDLIQKRLEEYLETKRAAFPRFYFLSNDELLQILSDSRDTRAVRPHLSKCFDSMKDIYFANEAGTEITAMISPEGESVPFSSILYARGPVENWLLQLERTMVSVLREHMHATLRANVTMKRLDWIMNVQTKDHKKVGFPAQCIQCIDLVRWSTDTEEAIAQGKLAEYHKEYQAQIMELVAAVRTNLSYLQRSLVGTLLVVDVHSRDVIKTLIQTGVTSSTDFDWTIQLRYYRNTSDTANEGDVDVLHVNAVFDYSFEYIGSAKRLVITPLTDRAFLTCTGALHMNLGGAPQGPAGTGKTESVKDLGKALARQVVVFNCSDGLNSRMMSQMFSGLAQGGAWACFDEFNRIELEVLSVIAQQMLDITTGVAQKMSRMVFDGRDVRLHKNFGVFITMNPGYAGRTELPDNLKALFRPVCMMVPNYRLIAEIMFFSEGFGNAPVLATKMVQLYKLSSEQLSKQDHYDFGMRAVKSILVMAGALKRSEPDADEDMLLTRALRDSNLPKFLRDDAKLFNALINDLYPNMEIVDADNSLLLNQLHQAMEELVVSPIATFTEKILQFHETTIVRHGVMLVGESLSGKTTCLSSLQRTLGELSNRVDKGEITRKPFFRTAHQHIVNPKSVTRDELYGALNPTTREWADGILSKIVRVVIDAAHNSPDRNWLVFDGPVDALWIENMNTVLDDNKMLCLVNGERLKFPDTISFIFEVQDLKVASPATVSRCGMVYFEAFALDGGWRPMLKCFNQRLAEQMSDNPPALPYEFGGPPSIEKLTADAAVAAEAAKTGSGGFGSPLSPQQILDKYQAPSIWDEKRIYDLAYKIIDKFEHSASKELSEWVPSSITQQTRSMLVLLEAVVRRISHKDDDPVHPELPKAEKDEDGREVPVEAVLIEVEKAMELAAPIEDQMKVAELIDMYVIFSFIWAFGGNLSEKNNSRDRFSDLARSIIQTVAPQVRFLPETGSVFDFFVRKTSGTWTPWQAKVPEFLFRSGAPFFELLVPTAESVATESVASYVLQSKNHVLISGSTGTGKSVGMIRMMYDELKTEDGDSSWMAFTAVLSAQTSSKQLQEKIEGRLRKHPSRAGTKNVCLGPAPGKTMLAFIDDLNMPFVEEYGATPPLELLRQLFVQGGFYNRKKGGFTDIIDTVVASCCGPPGGGRNEMPQRMTSRFFLLCQPALQRQTCHTIFRCILEGFTRPFVEDIRKNVNQVVGGTLRVYEATASKFLPRPEKSHYTFNLRDVARVIQGVMQVEPSMCNSAAGLIRLWAHEAMRVFHDRLADDKDRDAFSDMLVMITKEQFNATLSRQEVQGAMYGDFAAESDEKLYQTIEFNPSLSNLLMERLAEFSIQYTREMDLVMFPDAVRHLCRICRVLRQPRGNALLVGVGGSGRQSLAQLAAFINGMTLFQISITKNYGINEFREDLRVVLLDAGCDYKPTAFVLGGHQILEEQFLEDVNNLLNTGEVGNLWQPEDIDRIVNSVRPVVTAQKKPETQNVMMQTFVERCRDCLHIVLTMSPIGSEFRNRIRKFPALVSCMTIDWFAAWPDVALHSVALRILEKNGAMQESDREVVSKLCVSMHLSVKESETHFLQTQGRHAYTTPTSYISLLNLVSAMLLEQTEKLETEVKKFGTGVEKLRETNKSVDAMKDQLIKMQPLLAKQNEETIKFAEEVDRESRVASETAAVVAEEERQCNAITAEAATLRDECQVQLDLAMPAYYEAVDALNQLNPKDIQETRAYANPPKKVEVVINAVLTVLDEDLGWDNARKVMGRLNFIDMLRNFDKDNVPEKILKKLKKYTVLEELNPAVAQTVSRACVSLCLWCTAIENYCEVTKTVKPKKASLAIAEGKFQDARAILQKKQSELRAVEQKVAELKSQFQASQLRKQQLENEIQQTTLFLERAGRLLSGLASEETRWGEQLVTLHGKRPTLLCTAVLSAAFTAYCGFFTDPYRQKLLKLWIAKAESLRIATPHEFQFYGVNVDPVLTRKWQIAGLPNDNFSLDNGAIVAKSQRWCLCVDPQGQANAWIKKFYRDKGLKVIKATDQNIMRTIENCVRQGTPVLLENVVEQLDPGLDAILAKQIFRQAGRLLLRMRDGSIEYGENFFFIMTSRLANPHYVPEVQIKVTLLNFAVTQKGLEEQLLGEVVRHERRELEDKANKLVTTVADSKQQLTNIEEKILHMLSTSSGDLLSDEALTNTLQESKTRSTEITESLRIAEETQKEITTAREQYRSVAARGSILFSTVTSISNLEHMYQNALSFFVRQFNQTMAKTKKIDGVSVQGRCNSLINSITHDSYTVICRGLFETHKPMFAFLIAADVLRSNHGIPEFEWEFFLRGSGGDLPLGSIDNPDPKWLSQQQWDDLVLLGEKLDEVFGPVVQSVVKNTAAWKALLTSNLKGDAPSPWGNDEAALATIPTAAKQLSSFQTLVLFKTICEERVTLAARAFVVDQFGPAFLKSETFDLNTTFADSSFLSPIVFVLSSGTDPTQLFVNFAEERGFGQKKHMLSMGQGQGEIAQPKLEKAMRDGEWVYLQNCHVYQSWLPQLEAIVADTGAATPHEDYRLWLTTMPCSYFPVSVLQLSIKVTREPPRGLASNLSDSLGMIVRPTKTGQVWWDEFAPGESDKTTRWRKMLVCLISMHCITIERRRFGPLGWNIPYDWNVGDLDASIRSAMQFVEAYDALPWSAMRYILADINYGGRVMDALDLRCLRVLLDEICHEGNIMTEQSVAIQLPGETKLPLPPTLHMANEAKGFFEKSFENDVVDNPRSYGLHSNAGITYLTSQARHLASGVISVQPRVSSGDGGGSAGGSATSGLQQTIADLLDRMPVAINKDIASPESYRITDKGVMISLGTVLSQEVDRFTDLLRYLVKSLTQLQRALRGEVVMDNELESIASNLTFMQVPQIWEKKIPANRKPLTSWFADLVRRVDFFRDWNDTGIPMSFWMGSFFFPQGFLTGVLQTHSRQLSLPIDQLRFRVQVTKELDPDDPSDPNGLPILDSGVYTHGLFLEGARWSVASDCLDESNDRELFCKVPVMWLQPTHEEVSEAEEKLFECPMYKISSRAGVLSTTGISTNYVLGLRLPTGKESAAHWTVRGSAMLTQLDD